MNTESPAADSPEFATTPVPANRRVGWLRVGLVSAMVGFSLPTFVAGVEVFAATPNDEAVLAVLLGCAMLSLIGAVTGSIGARTHLSSYMLVRIAFGVRGAALVNIAFALSLLGWFGVNIDLFGAALLRLFADVSGIAAPPWLVELFAGAVMTVTTIYGFTAINRLSMLLVPVMMVVTALLLNTAFGVASPAEIFTVGQGGELRFGDAVSAVVGGVIVGAVILPDITRFISHWRGAAYTAVLSYLLVNSVVMIAGGVAAEVLMNDDFLDVMLVMGLGWGAFVIIIAGSWVLNTLNLYSATLSVEATFPRLENRLSIIALGVFGTGCAFLNILDYFLTFLFYLAIVFVPVAGVIAVDYLYARRSAFHDEFATAGRNFSPLALSAWAAGAAVALLGAAEIIRFSGIAALDAMLVSALAYGLLCRFGGGVAPQAASSESERR